MFYRLFGSIQSSAVDLSIISISIELHCKTGDMLLVEQFEERLQRV